MAKTVRSIVYGRLGVGVSQQYICKLQFRLLSFKTADALLLFIRIQREAIESILACYR
jgi:hypothetical protein